MKISRFWLDIGKNELEVPASMAFISVDNHSLAAYGAWDGKDCEDEDLVKVNVYCFNTDEMIDDELAENIYFVGTVAGLGVHVFAEA